MSRVIRGNASLETRPARNTPEPSISSSRSTRARLPALPRRLPVAEQARHPRARGAREVARLQVPPLQQPLRGGGRHGAALQDSSREAARPPVPYCSSRFGTSSNMRAHCKTVHEKAQKNALEEQKVAARGKKKLEKRGFEPLTFRLQSGRANHCATSPF